MDDVVDRGSVVALDSFSVALDPRQESERADLLSRIDAAEFAPPLQKELAKKARSLVRDAIRQRGELSVAEIRDLLGTTRKYAVPLCEWLDATGATVRRGDTRILGPND
jgi:hypothetical protein